MKATARKLAVLYYRVLTKGFAFVEHGLEVYERNVKEHQLQLLHKKAFALGLLLVPQ